MCSHRGPVSYRRLRGQLVPQRGGGGLIGAIAPVLERFGGTWIASAMSPADREVAREPGPREIDGYRLHLLDLPEDVHAAHYDTVSNEHLWFVFHYLFDVSNAPVFGSEFMRAWDAYREINRRYARTMLEAGGDAVFVEDYHLMSVAEEARTMRRRLAVPLLYHHHVPWSEPDYFAMLPRRVVEDVLRGMLAFDVVGFHAARWARAFLACCERLLPGTDVSDDAVSYKGRRTRVTVAPIPLDVARVREAAAAPKVDGWRERFEALARGRRTLLRVDRVELSKNVLRGFLAFEELLERRPRLARDVWFLALVYPSRPRVGEYRRYLGACLAVTHRINQRFGSRAPGDEGPLGLYVQDDYQRSLAGMQMSDVLLVNPVFDGLNLVAKEGPAVNTRDGVLVLSRNAGVFEEIGDAALPVNPFDVVETAGAIERAVEMPAAERAKRAARLRRVAATGTPDAWVRSRLESGGVTTG